MWWIRNKKFPQLNNRGISLLEVLVVVAILGVLIGIMSTSFYIVSKTNITKAANYVNDALTLCREKAMTNSAVEWDVVIKDGYVDVVKLSYEEDEGGERTLTATSHSTMQLPSYAEMSIEVDGTEYAVDDSHSISISYKQNGEIGIVRYYDSRVGVTADNLESGALFSSSVSTTTSYCYVIARHKTKEEKVIIYYATGKHGVED